MAIHRSMQLMIVLAALAQAAEPPKFLSALDCAMCHNRIPEAGGEWSTGKSVAPYPNWQGSMMAHSPGPLLESQGQIRSRAGAGPPTGD